jgi:putative ABC transport system permease protein
MRDLGDDIRFGLRTIRKNPGFSSAAVLVLGLGIGANAAVFSFLDALFLRPFPFEGLDRLMTVWETHPQQGRQPDAAHTGSGQRYAVAPADYLDWKENQAFERFAAFRYRELNLTGGDQPERVRAVLATAEFFPGLGVPPMLGRTIMEEDERPGHDAVVLLSHALWRDRFGSDPDVVGRTCALNGRAYTVVGVMPSDFDFPLGGVRLWLPLALSPAERVDRRTLSLQILARLRPGVTPAQARAEMGGIAARLAREHPQTNAGRGVALVPLAEQQVGFTVTFAAVFQAAGALVLLITCANLANLLLARGLHRQRELAVRAALGASRGRLVRQLLTESALLSLLGGALAVWLAQGGVSVLRASVPDDIVKWVGGWRAIEVERRTLAYTFALAVLTSLLFGALPARQAARARLGGLLSEAGRGSSGGRSRLRSLLVVSELTLAMVLLVGAGLMVRGTLRLTNVYQGFDPEGVMTLRIALPDEKYAGAQAAHFFQSLLERLASLSPVESAALVSQIPADLGPMPGGAFSVEGRAVRTAGELPVADFQTVSPDYFRTLRIGVLRGRAFSHADGPGAPAVAIVNDAAARRLWGDEDPLGRRVKVGPPDAPGDWMQIVGVVSDVKQYWFDREPRLTLYFPYAQSPRPRMSVLVRTSGDVHALAALARAQVSGLDPDQPIFEVRTLAEAVHDSMAFVRMAAALMVAFGALALVLAALGVYGVLTHHVSQRTREIGIRLAVGAGRHEILGLVVGQALKLTALGLALGLPMAVAASALMARALFGVVRPDALGLLGVAAGLGLVAFVSSGLPAWRAVRVDPIQALRE